MLTALMPDYLKNEIWMNLYAQTKSGLVFCIKDILDGPYIMQSCSLSGCGLIVDAIGGER
jgi:hypothetical protein